MLAEGHQITNHGYRHIIFGKKPFVYGAREYLPGFDAAVEDLSRLHTLMQTRYGYTMTLARPPHYVDKMTGGFTSYDVYDHMGYQYMAASFDGAGWLPSTEPDPEAALQAEIRAMVEPMRKALEKDPDFFCGQIIFQKDGYNMAKRTPVAFALGEQLALLQEYGYQVVPVGELLAESPFADVGRDEPMFDRLTALAEQRAIAFADNRLRLDDPMTVGELAMLLAPKAEAITRRVAQLRQTGRAGASGGSRDRAAGGVVCPHGRLHPPGCLCGVAHGAALSDAKTNGAGRKLRPAPCAYGIWNPGKYFSAKATCGTRNVCPRRYSRMPASVGSVNVSL